jgi:hypothetical protein
MYVARLRKVSTSEYRTKRVPFLHAAPARESNAWRNGKDVGVRKEEIVVRGNNTNRLGIRMVEPH